ncbi:MAG: hypothetical protein AABY53_01850, partial [Bdellovibrionota bacterium]
MQPSSRKLLKNGYSFDQKLNECKIDSVTINSNRQLNDVIQEGVTLQPFTLSYSRKYKIGMGLAFLFLILVAVTAFARTANECFYKPDSDWVLIAFGIFAELAMVLGCVFAFLWINTQKVVFDGQSFKITTLLATNEYLMSDMVSYWRINEKQVPAVYFKKDGKTFSVAFDTSLDPEGKMLKLIEEKKIPFNNPDLIKNLQSMLVIIFFTFIFALCLFFD